MIPAPGTERTKLVATSAGLLVGGLGFVLTLLDWSPSLTRTALATRYFSGFYDLQARRLLAGHVDVPTGSLGIEGFVHDGKTFMYFPPWPAILRLPVLLTTHEYDGQLTILSMAIAWIVFRKLGVGLPKQGDERRLVSTFDDHGQHCTVFVDDLHGVVVLGPVITHKQHPDSLRLVCAFSSAEGQPAISWPRAHHLGGARHPRSGYAS